MRAGSHKVACGPIPVLGLIGDVEFDRACTSKVLLGRLRVRCWRTVLCERARAKSLSGTCALRACEHKPLFIHEERRHPKLTSLVPARTKPISDCSAQKHSERRWGCRVCASGREQSPSRASARVVLDLDFVRAGSSKVPLGHLRSSCLRGVVCERARTKRISSHIGRNLRFVGEVEFVCAGSSKPLLGAWMCSSTCAASAAPVEQTAASDTK